MKTLVPLILMLSFAAACSQSAPEKSAELTPVVTPEHPSVVPLPDPEMQEGHIGRAPRRLTVAQLKESIITTAGRPWASLDTLATSLGKADYAVVNSENIEPNLVFAKFLEDGAREVCVAQAQSELAVTVAANRVLTRELPEGAVDYRTLTDAAIQKNLEYLSLRFWGSTMKGEELAKFTGTFKTVTARAYTINKREQAWASVCIALMTDSRFTTY